VDIRGFADEYGGSNVTPHQERHTDASGTDTHSERGKRSSLSVLPSREGGWGEKDGPNW